MNFFYLLTSSKKRRVTFDLSDSDSEESGDSSDSEEEENLRLFFPKKSKSKFSKRRSSLQRPPLREPPPPQSEFTLRPILKKTNFTFVQTPIFTSSILPLSVINAVINSKLGSLFYDQVESDSDNNDTDRENSSRTCVEPERSSCFHLRDNSFNSCKRSENKFSLSGSSGDTYVNDSGIHSFTESEDKVDHSDTYDSVHSRSLDSRAEIKNRKLKPHSNFVKTVVKETEENSDKTKQNPQEKIPTPCSKNSEFSTDNSSSSRNSSVSRFSRHRKLFDKHPLFFKTEEVSNKETLVVPIKKFKKVISSNYTKDSENKRKESAQESLENNLKNKCLEEKQSPGDNYIENSKTNDYKSLEHSKTSDSESRVNNEYFGSTVLKNSNTEQPEVSKNSGEHYSKVTESLSCKFLEQGKFGDIYAEDNNTSCIDKNLENCEKFSENLVIEEESSNCNVLEHQNHRASQEEDEHLLSNFIEDKNSHESLTSNSSKDQQNCNNSTFCIEDNLGSASNYPTESTDAESDTPDQVHEHVSKSNEDFNSSVDFWSVIQTDSGSSSKTGNFDSDAEDFPEETVTKKKVYRLPFASEREQSPVKDVEKFVDNSGSSIFHKSKLSCKSEKDQSSDSVNSSNNTVNQDNALSASKPRRKVRSKYNECKELNHVPEEKSLKNLKKDLKRTHTKDSDSKRKVSKESSSSLLESNDNSSTNLVNRKSNLELQDQSQGTPDKESEVDRDFWSLIQTDSKEFINAGNFDLDAEDYIEGTVQNQKDTAVELVSTSSPNSYSNKTVVSDSESYRSCSAEQSSVVEESVETRSSAEDSSCTLETDNNSSSNYQRDFTSVEHQESSSSSFTDNNNKDLSSSLLEYSECQNYKSCKDNEIPGDYQLTDTESPSCSFLEKQETSYNKDLEDSKSSSDNHLNENDSSYQIYPEYRDNTTTEYLEGKEDLSKELAKDSNSADITSLEHQKDLSSHTESTQSYTKNSSSTEKSVLESDHPIQDQERINSAKDCAIVQDSNSIIDFWSVIQSDTSIPVKTGDFDSDTEEEHVTKSETYRLPFTSSDETSFTKEPSNYYSTSSKKKVLSSTGNNTHSALFQTPRLAFKPEKDQSSDSTSDSAYFSQDSRNKSTSLPIKKPSKKVLSRYGVRNEELNRVPEAKPIKKFKKNFSTNYTKDSENRRKNSEDHSNSFAENTESSSSKNGRSEIENKNLGEIQGNLSSADNFSREDSSTDFDFWALIQADSEETIKAGNFDSDAEDFSEEQLQERSSSVVDSSNSYSSPCEDSNKVKINHFGNTRSRSFSLESASTENSSFTEESPESLFDSQDYNTNFSEELLYASSSGSCESSVSDLFNLRKDSEEFESNTGSGIKLNENNQLLAIDCTNRDFPTCEGEKQLVEFPEESDINAESESAEVQESLTNSVCVKAPEINCHNCLYYEIVELSLPVLPETISKTYLTDHSDILVIFPPVILGSLENFECSNSSLEYLNPLDENSNIKEDFIEDLITKTLSSEVNLDNISSDKNSSCYTADNSNSLVESLKGQTSVATAEPDLSIRTSTDQNSLPQPAFEIHSETSQPSKRKSLKHRSKSASRTRSKPASEESDGYSITVKTAKPDLLKSLNLAILGRNLYSDLSDSAQSTPTKRVIKPYTRKVHQKRNKMSDFPPFSLDINCTGDPETLLSSKRDDIKEKDILIWIYNMIDEPARVDYEFFLKDGCILCKLMNRIKPGCIPEEEITWEGSRSKQKNVFNFLREAEKYGVPRAKLFFPEDLLHLRHIPRVTRCIFGLAKLAQDDSNIPNCPRIGDEPSFMEAVKKVEIPGHRDTKDVLTQLTTTMTKKDEKKSTTKHSLYK